MIKRKKATAFNIPMCVASVLLCLTLLSIHFTTGLYARYTVSSSDQDIVRVVSFGELTLTETGDFEPDGKMMIIPGVDLTKKAVIDFTGSETSTYVFVEAVLSPSWQTSDNSVFYISSSDKLLMQWEIENCWQFLQADNGTYIFYQELSPNASLTSDIIAENGNIYVSDQITKSEISGMTGVSIIFRASAVQSSGFDGPDDAWSAISKK